MGVIGGLYELARLALITRFRLRGRYWSWRLHTAHGGPKPAGLREKIGRAIRYGKWLREMRRDMRAGAP